MINGLRPIRQVRVDILMKSAWIYLFVERSHSKWDLWWGRFFEFLMTFESDELEWHIHPEGDSAVCRPRLTELARAHIVNFIRTAPQSQIDTHTTLRRAVEMTRAQQECFELVYFSGDISGLSVAE